MCFACYSVDQAGQFARWRVLEGARRSLWTLAACVNEEADLDAAGYLGAAAYTPGRLTAGGGLGGVWAPLLPRLPRRYVFRLAAGLAPPVAPPSLWRPGELGDDAHAAFPATVNGGASGGGPRVRLLALVLRCGWGLGREALAEALDTLRQQGNGADRPHDDALSSLPLVPLSELRRAAVAELRRQAAAEACPVCLERPAEGSSGSRRKGAGEAWACAHAVCAPCLASMAQHGLDATCPICRAPNACA